MMRSMKMIFVMNAVMKRDYYDAAPFFLAFSPGRSFARRLGRRHATHLMPQQYDERMFLTGFI